MILGIAADGRVDFCAGSPEDLCGRGADDLLDRRLVVRPGLRLRLQFLADAPARPTGRGGLECPEDGWPGVGLDQEHQADLVCQDGGIRPVTLMLSRRRTRPGRPAAAYVAVLDPVDVRMTDLMATASHELRTPVTSILGYAELLRSSPGGIPPATMHQLLGRIERNARRLKGLIEDMLTMSQVEAGGFRLERRVLDLRDPLARALDAVRPVLPVRELELRTAVSEHPVPVVGDGDRLERAFTHLLDNAVKFSLVGDVIEVDLREDGGEALVRVVDHGVGIEPDERPRVFERFFRGSRAHELVTQGSGLGLAVTQAVVTGHDGRVEVESAPGQGSRFTVRLPLHR